MGRVVCLHWSSASRLRVPTWVPAAWSYLFAEAYRPRGSSAERWRAGVWSRNRKVLHATCALHRSPVGLPNVVVNKRGGTIVFNPHVDDACVVTLAEVRPSPFGMC